MGFLFMPKTGIRLFQIFGITVFLHWSWLLVAAYELEQRRGAYQNFAWNIAEYLSLFAIVLLHEFGHALACRSVGGKADRIVLWPLGGVAYVRPPMRPGAMLWSIVAGPLVNVALLPITLPFLFQPVVSDAGHYLQSVAYINAGLLIFNILPIYPLDGGKILWSLLWFVIGCGNALLTASVIGLVGAAGLAIFAFKTADTWLVLIAVFAGWQAWVGFKSAQMLRKREAIPRRAGFVCPECGTSPPMAPLWTCSRCRKRFDAFEHPLACPNCGTANRAIACPNCGARAPIGQWGRVNMPDVPPLPPIPQNSN
jgi:Zn-dependent protease/DNA-directed RNA polymerase subunit RPC12/RpoP